MKYYFLDCPGSHWGNVIAIEAHSEREAEVLQNRTQSPALPSQLANKFHYNLPGGAMVIMKFENKIQDHEEGCFVVSCIGTRQIAPERYKIYKEAEAAYERMVKYAIHGHPHEENLQWVRERLAKQEAKYAKI